MIPDAGGQAGHQPGPATLPGAGQDMATLLAPAQAPDEIGRLGPYRVLRVLGAGGMGVVFEAEDVQLERRVALKVIRPDQAGEVARQRFLREARAAAAIEHDHIVPIFQVGEASVEGVGVVPYLAMPLLRGETLDTCLQRQGKLPVAEVLRIGRELALGLAIAHKRGLVHRDIKPANIWLEAETRRIKILDFGLARLASTPAHAQAADPLLVAARPSSGPQALTEVGSLLGTPAYMSPEQIGGQPVDARSDLFSLGCVLYLMATGELPFKGDDTLATLTAVALDEPSPPRQLNPQLPAALSQRIVELLAKKPTGRPTSAQAVAEALARIEQTATARRRHRWRALLIAACLLLVLLGIGIFWAGLHTRDKDKQDAVESKPTDFTPNRRVNLLARIDPDRDVVRVRGLNQEWISGKWSIQKGQLWAAPSRGQNVIEIPYRPPQEYDLCVEFTRFFGTGDISFALSKDGRSFQWCAAVENKLFGFNMVDGRPLQESPLAVRLENAVRNGHRHAAVVQVRRHELKAFLDDRLVNELATDGSNLTMFYAIRLRDDRLLGLSTWTVPAVFHRVEVVEVSGPGTFTRPAPSGTQGE
jgi:serine/threonine protein kinase